MFIDLWTTPFLNHFLTFFAKVSEISGRTTRSSGNRHSLYIPRYNTNRLQQSMKYQGVKIWNSSLYPLKFKTSHSLLQKKKKYKTHLMQTYEEK